MAFNLFATVAHAAGTSFSIQNPIAAKDFQSLLKQITDAIRNIAIPVAVIMILWSGFNFLTAAGNPTKITKARGILMYTAIGLAIVFIGGGFVDFIQSILGAK
jgi:hypothetical protein